MIIQELDFRKIRGACIEQYDVFKGGRWVGYVRLCLGTVACDFPDCSGNTIYSHSFNVGWKGCFDGPEERETFLNKIATAIHAALEQEKQERKQ